MIAIPLELDALAQYADISEYTIHFTPEGKFSSHHTKYVDFLPDHFVLPIVEWIVPTFSPDKPFWRVGNVMAGNLGEAKQIAIGALEKHRSEVEHNEH